MGLVRGLYVLRRAWNVLITQLVQDAQLAFTSIPRITHALCALRIVLRVLTERFVVGALLATP
jgi:hypothetical protein